MTPSMRAKHERAARILLMVGLAPLPLGVAFLVWLFGYNVHPHQVGFACIVAGIFGVVAFGIQWLLYHVRIKRAKRLP